MPPSTAAVLTRRAATLVYGTAGKGSKTQDLVEQAIRAGFRSIDTAAQPRSYAEDLVGNGVRNILKAQALTRKDFWLQTKFTPVHDQDDAAPYKRDASIADQVDASIKHSSRNLFVGEHAYLDAVLLHSPYQDSKSTLDVWRALSTHVTQDVRTIGISNVSMDQLDEVVSSAAVKPTIVQNAFTAENGYDLRLRAYCRDKDIAYQAYSVLTGNEHLLQSSVVQELAQASGITQEATLYALIVLGLNISVLNGTTNFKNMQDDLIAIDKVRTWRENNRNKWMNMVSSFKGSLSRGRIL